MDNQTTAAASAAARAFAARSAVRSQLSATQAAEHVFFAESAQLVASAAVQLTSYFSGVLQEKMPRWFDSQLQRFALSSGIEKARLLEWCQLWATLQETEDAVSLAAAKSAAAKQKEAQFSGLIWGAKKGFEQQYAAAGRELQAANTAEAKCEEQAKSRRNEARTLGEQLLRHCVAEAINIAKGSPDETVSGILADLNAATVALDGAHRQSQMRALRQMREQLDELTRIYERA